MAAFSTRKAKSSARKRKQWRLSPVQAQLVVGIFLFIVVALILTAVWYASRISSLQIDKIAVIGGETVPHASIENSVQSVLMGTYFKLVPKRFMLTYPKKDIEQALYSHDRVKNVQVELTDDQTLTVTFEEHVPFALWCEEFETEVCFFIDKNGYAFTRAPELQGSAFVRYADEGAVPVEDVYAFEEQFMQDTQQFITLLEEQLNLNVAEVFKRGAYDVEFSVSGGGIIKVSQAVPMQESFENLQTILLSEQFKHLEPGSFQYIDLRFGDKIFVNEEIAVPETDTATSTSEL